MATPVAYDEGCDPDIFWESDRCDDLLPDSKGFLSDMIYYTRGREVPSIFVIWSAILSISGAVKRDAWLKWADGKMFANVFCMICAPAGAAKKNTAIDLSIKLLRNLDVALADIGADNNIVQMKTIDPFHSRATPEALISMMVPEKRRGVDFDFKDQEGNLIIGPNGKPLRYYQSSEMVVLQHEMAAMLGRQGYMEGIMDLLLNFFDCHDEWEYTTQTRGNETLRNIFVSFMAALTPTTIKASLPDAATGDGFLSRCQLVYQPYTDRCFSEPMVPEGAPSRDELQKRLAWIAANTFGEWKFSPEAHEWKEHWYKSFKNSLGSEGMYMGLKSRWDVILYKLAMIIRWQRYERNDQLIHVQDVVDAEHILRRTFMESLPAYRMVVNNKLSDRGLKVEEYLSKHGTASRRELIKNLHIGAEDLDIALNLLVDECRAEAWLGDRQQTKPTGRNNEVYKYTANDEKIKRRSTNLNLISSPANDLGAQPEVVYGRKTSIFDEIIQGKDVRQKYLGGDVS